MTAALNVILFMASAAALGAYYCRIDLLKYGVDPIGRIGINVLGGGSAAWSLGQAAQLQADWRAWVALVLCLAVLVLTYRYTGIAQKQRAKLASKFSEEGV